jgi:hypothetical protein
MSIAFAVISVRDLFMDIPGRRRRSFWFQSGNEGELSSEVKLFEEKKADLRALELSASIHKYKDVFSRAGSEQMLTQH